MLRHPPSHPRPCAEYPVNNFGAESSACDGAAPGGLLVFRHRRRFACLGTSRLRRLSEDDMLVPEILRIPSLCCGLRAISGEKLIPAPKTSSYPSPTAIQRKRRSDIAVGSGGWQQRSAFCRWCEARCVSGRMPVVKIHGIRKLEYPVPAF